ncbi:MAG: hypothetical protein LBQ30_00545, partial [Treponema sp.]|nr:hypothetical protein [Treponema sp.]
MENKLMGKYCKKLIAPILVVILIILYYIFYGYIIVKLGIPRAIKIIGIIFPVIIIGIFILA